MMGIPGATCACLVAIVKWFVLSLLAIICAVVSVVVFFFLAVVGAEVLTRAWEWLDDFSRRDK